jgi:hypothetical protein
MFDRVGSLAERLASDVSRRALLGRLGRGALGLAAVLGGVLALPSQAQAGDQWCLISFPIGGACQTYKAINGTCPCGGELVSYKHSRCASRNCH